MALQYLFANVTTAPTSEIDTNFQTVGLLGILPCSVSGTNALVLTLLNSTNTPTVSAYANYLAFSFVAGATNTGAVTLRVGALSTLNVYKPSGSGPAALSAGDIVAGSLYTVYYDSALNSGTGGFHINVNNGLTAPQTANTIYAGPTSGTIAVPTFRTLVTADLNSVAGQLPGATSNTNASVGNVGELMTSTITAASPVALTSGTVATITKLDLTPGDWDVWMLAAFGGGTTATVTNLQSGLNTVATIPTLGGQFGAVVGAGAALFNFSSDVSCPAGPVRYSVSSTLTTLSVYGIAEAVYASSSVTVYGVMRARRVR